MAKLEVKDDAESGFTPGSASLELFDRLESKPSKEILASD
ncbi:hypothetical protein NIES2104_08700 [Leptolyngbya sp. NIES-2104]|nr:hypothetical protein NIES2104_08700 [Leptolyngbya sp. NIES-2104]